MPAPDYSAAEKHNQFRTYYGYHPAATPSLAHPCTYPPQPPAAVRSAAVAAAAAALTTAGSRRPIYAAAAGEPRSLPPLPRPNPHGAGRAGPASLHTEHTNPAPAPATTVARLTAKYQTMTGTAAGATD